MIDGKQGSLTGHIVATLFGLACAVSLGAQQPSNPSTPAPATTATSAPAAPSAATLEWKAYAFADEGFSASFPAQPEFEKRDVPTEKGSFELRTYRSETNSVSLFVGISDYGTAVTGRNPEDVLMGAEDGALSNSGSHLISDNKITFGVYRGRTFESENESAHFSARIYLVGSTLYQTLVVYPIGKPYDGTARFLDSFQLIARVAK